MPDIRAADNFMRSVGLDAYRVGGSVRDRLMDRDPKDADYVVRNVSLAGLRDALAAEGGRPTRIQLRNGAHCGYRTTVPGFGLVEVVLPRTEISTGPGRQDFEIIVDPSLPLEEDAQRRDFTVNALYMDVRTNVVEDPLGTGLSDLSKRLLNTTNASSFRDDPLRMLRALRFVSRLPGFDLSKVTYAQMCEHADAAHGLTVKGVSGTALDELCKILMGRRVARALRYGRDSGVLTVLLPELEPMIGFEQESKYHDMTTDEHTFTALDAAAAMHVDLRVRMALLFHDCGKPDAAWKGKDGRLHYYAPSWEAWREANSDDEGRNGSQWGDPPEDHEVYGARWAVKALKRLNASRALIDDVETIILRHMVPLHAKVKPAKVRRWRCEIGDELLSDLLKHRLADLMGKGTINYDAMAALARLETIRQEAQDARVPATVKDLHVGGEDAKALGLVGRDIGTALRAVLYDVVSQPNETKLSREWQLERLRKGA